MGREKYDLIHVMDPVEREPIPLWIKKYKRTGKLVRDANGTVHYKKPLKLGKSELKKNVQRLPHVWGGWVQAALSVLPLIPAAIDGVKSIWHSIFGGKINPNDLPRQIIDIPASRSVDTIGQGIFGEFLRSHVKPHLKDGVMATAHFINDRRAEEDAHIQDMIKKSQAQVPAGKLFLGQGVPMAPGRLSYVGSGLEPGKKLLVYPIVKGSDDVQEEYAAAVDSIPGGRIHDGYGGRIYGEGVFDDRPRGMTGYQDWMYSKKSPFGKTDYAEPGKYASVAAPPVNNDAVSPLH